jgi:precorrin-6B methylase 2
MPRTNDTRHPAFRHITKETPLFALRPICLATAVAYLALIVSPPLFAEQAKPYRPVPGQSGKDSVWVPTTYPMIAKMLDLAKVRPDDLAIDLGSGDGRMVIAVAQRGARAIGVEWNPDLIALSEQRARAAGVANKVRFVRHDMFTYDLSEATLLPLFMLPEQFEKLTAKFLGLRPGTRIVVNTYQIPEWEADQKATIGGACARWCEAYLYIVPARVAGVWKTELGELKLDQFRQRIFGTLVTDGKAVQVTGRLLGADITFTAADVRYSGVVNGNEMRITPPTGAPWTAVRQ